MKEKTNIKYTKWGHFEVITGFAVNEICFNRALVDQKQVCDEFMIATTGKRRTFIYEKNNKYRLAPVEDRDRYARRGGPVGVYMTLVGYTTLKRNIDDIVTRSKRLLASLMVYAHHRKYLHWRWDYSPGCMFCDYLALYTNNQWDFFTIMGLYQWLSVAIPHHVFCVHIPFYKKTPLYLKNGRWMQYFVGNHYRITLPEHLVGDDMFMYSPKEQYMMLADFMGDCFYKKLVQEESYGLSGKLEAIDCFCCSPERIAKTLVVRNPGARFVRDPLAIFSSEGEQEKDLDFSGLGRWLDETGEG